MLLTLNCNLHVYREAQNPGEVDYFFVLVFVFFGVQFYESMLWLLMYNRNLHHCVPST